MGFSALDYAIFVVIGIAAIYGAMKGLLHFAVFAVSVAGTFVLFGTIHRLALSALSFYSGTVLWRIILFLALFITLTLVLRLIQNVLYDFFEALLIGWLDNLLGGVVFTIIAAFLVYFVALFISAVSGHPVESFGSRTLVLFQDISAAVLTL